MCYCFKDIFEVPHKFNHHFDSSMCDINFIMRNRKKIEGIIENLFDLIVPRDKSKSHGIKLSTVVNLACF